MDHVGFNYNPRKRAIGYHEIYKYYDSKIKEYSLKRDRIYWHYHPMSFSHHAHRMGYNYSYSGNLHNEILSRRIIDKNWFPVANRPGGHIETYDINAWLEQWIPFDLANQSTLENTTASNNAPSKSMLIDRHGDWRGGFPDWIIFISFTFRIFIILREIIPTISEICFEDIFNFFEYSVLSFLILIKEYCSSELVFGGVNSEIRT